MRKAMNKRAWKTALPLVLICMIFTHSMSMSAKAADIMPYYNNAISTLSNADVSSSGVITISYKYVGIPNVTTKAVLTIYIEKRTLGLFWTRVDIGEPDNQWVITKYLEKYTGSQSFQLSSKGTYRVTVKYKIYGTGGSADEETWKEKVTY